MPKVVSHKAALYNAAPHFASPFLHIICFTSPRVAARMHKKTAESLRRSALFNFPITIFFIEERAAVASRFLDAVQRLIRHFEELVTLMLLSAERDANA